MKIYHRIHHTFLSHLLCCLKSPTFGQQRWNHIPRTIMEIFEGTGSQPYSVIGPLNTPNRRIVDSRNLRINSESILPFVWSVLKTLRRNGYAAYLVGGCVRDLILQRIPKDFDVITTASLKQIKMSFRRCIIIGRRFPICQIFISGNVIEVSSFNTYAECGDEQETYLLPKLSNNFNDSDFKFWKNCMSRDFTINCLFFDLFNCKIYDYVGALNDLKSFKVHTIIPPHLSFKNDCARILRGMRIAARLGLRFSTETEAAINDFSPSILTLSKDRLMLEMNFMMAHGAAASSINLLHEYKLLESLLPAHAAYLTSQSNNVSAQKPVMLMELFVNADDMLRADRPCCCNLWLGLLAFHLALVDNPQDALVIWAFSCILYHGTWNEAVKFVKGSSSGLIHYVPEILETSVAKPDDQLYQSTSQFAFMAKSAVKSLTDTQVLRQSVSKYSPLLSSKCLVFVPEKTGKKVCELFDITKADRNFNGNAEQRQGINYELLKKGDLNETRFVLGKIIMDTMKAKSISESVEKIDRVKNYRIPLSKLFQ